MSYKRSNLLNILQIIKTYRWRERPARALVLSTLVLGYISLCRSATDRRLQSNLTMRNPIREYRHERDARASGGSKCLIEMRGFSLEIVKYMTYKR